MERCPKCGYEEPKSKKKSVWSPQLQAKIDETLEMGRKLQEEVREKEKLRKR